MTRVRMLRFTRHYKDTIQQRLTRLISFVPNLLEYTYAENYRNRTRLDKIIAKNGAVFIDSQCRRTAIHTGHYVVQGHSRSLIFVPIESSYATSH